MGAVIASDRVAEPFLEGTTSFTHGFTFGGHPVSAAIAMANLDVFEREQILRGNVRANEARFREMLESLRDIPIVGDVRGTGYFHAIELVKDRETKESFDDEESETLLRGFLSGELLTSQRPITPSADVVSICAGTGESQCGSATGSGGDGNCNACQADELGYT